MIVQLQEEDIKHRFEVDGSLDLYEKALMDVRGILRKNFLLRQEINLMKFDHSMLKF